MEEVVAGLSTLPPVLPHHGGAPPAGPLVTGD
jgi:hypothetical protein